MFLKNFNPIVSIVIPVYNGEEYLREAIDSVLNQTYRNIEIIIVNDGSIDKSEEIIKSYTDNRIRYFKKENGGVASALNLGIKNMKGEYFSWLSHDDIYYQDKIEKQISALSKLDKDKRDKTILYSNWVLIDKDSKMFDVFRIEKRYDKRKLNYPLYPIVKCIVHGCSLLIPKICFYEVGLFNEKEKTTQDYEMWFRMFPKYNILFQPYFVVKFRNHDKQGTNTIKNAKLESDALWLRINKKLTDQDRISIDGNLNTFYKRMIRFTSESGYINTNKYLLNRLKNIGGRINRTEEFLIKTKERVENKLRRIFFQVF